MKMNSRTGLYLILIVLCIAGIITGSFFDLQISETLYAGDSLFSKIICFATVIIFFESCIFFLGVLFRQFWVRYGRILPRIVVCVIFIYLFCSTATLGGAKILNDQLIQGSFSGLAGTLHGSFIVGSVFCIAAFVIGFLINGNRQDAGTTKILIKIIMIFTIGFLMSHYLNCMIDRQSYSVLVNGGNIEGFMPWYRLPKDSKLLMSFTDLITSHQGSFVSSHALYAVLFIIIFPSYSLAIPSLKKHEKLLMVIAGIVSVTVILCRILSGNNYLTDISFGALYSLKFSMSYNGINKTRKPGKPAQIFRK